MILSKHRPSRSVAAASLSLMLVAFGVAANGWSQQHAAQPASAGDIVASVARSTEGRIGDGAIEARWPLDDGRPESLEIRDVCDGDRKSVV